MKYEIPGHPWFTVNKFPNHSIENVTTEKIKWFLEAFHQILQDESTRYRLAIQDLSTVICHHYEEVKRQYAKGHTTAEGVPIRGLYVETPLERAINTAWVMNCEFYPSGMIRPGELEGLEYFAYTRLHYPYLYDLFIEWAWG